MALWRARRERWLRVGRVAIPGWSEFLATGRAAHLALGVAWALGWAGLALASLYPVSVFPWSLPSFPGIAAACAALAHLAGARAALRKPRGQEG